MINKLKLADLNVRIDTDSQNTENICGKYLYEFRSEPDVFVSVTLSDVKKLKEKRRGQSDSEAENELVLKGLAGKLAQLSAVIINCSSINENGIAYIQTEGKTANGE